jgi:hypothetical protein
VWSLQEPIDQRLLKQAFSQFVQSQGEFDLWFKQRVLASACVAALVLLPCAAAVRCRLSPQRICR